jgi:hypothetical protein
LIARLITAAIVFGVSMFCGLVIVSAGMLSGRFNTLYPYTAGDVCNANEKLILETDATTTAGGTVVIDGNAVDGMGYARNTIYCVNASGEKRDVTNATYEAFDKLKTRIGWYATLAFFIVTMILILVFERPILRRVDRIIGYQPSKATETGEK